MKTYNEDFYHQFNEIADLLSILNENRFKIIAYQNAARFLKDADPIYKKGANEEEFRTYRGIGVDLSKKMMEYIETGKIKHLTELQKQIPKPVRDLLLIPHLGPNRVQDLYQKLGIKSKNDLKKALSTGEIEELQGFGPKLLSSIKNAIEKGQEKKKRHSRKDIKPLVKKITSLLKGIKGISKIEIAGSYRRGSSSVGDIDILTVGSSSVGAKILEAVKKQFPDHTKLAEGETKVAFVIFPDNLQVDIRFVPKESWGAALLYFTGSKDFNVEMRRIAIEKGWLLNEYGLFDGGEYIAGTSEKEVFDKLEIKPVEPKKRK